MQVIYGRTPPAYRGERVWQNARFFNGPLKGVEVVYLDGDFPGIAKAYEAEGAKVHQGSPDPLDHDGSGEPGGMATPLPKRRRRVRRKPS